MIKLVISSVTYSFAEEEREKNFVEEQLTLQE